MSGTAARELTKARRGETDFMRRALGYCFCACRCPKTAAHFWATCIIGGIAAAQMRKSKMRLGLVILPEEICDKVEGFGDGRTGVRPSRSPKDLAQPAE